MGYSMGVPARLVSDSTVSLSVEAEGHNNWLRTFACCVWESQASPRRCIPASFRISLILPFIACGFLQIFLVIALCTLDFLGFA